MTTETGFEALMGFVCGAYGYCGCVKNGQPFHVTLLIPQSGFVTAHQFADWVFLADNQNPNTERKVWLRHKKAIRDAFVEHMGSEVVSASRLQFAVDTKNRSAITDLVECQIEFCRTNPDICIRNLVARKSGIFYPADRVTGKGLELFPQIEVCWFEHNTFWPKDDKEPVDPIKIVFHHMAGSQISSRVFYRAQLSC